MKGPTLTEGKLLCAKLSAMEDRVGVGYFQGDSAGAEDGLLENSEPAANGARVALLGIMAVRAT